MISSILGSSTFNITLTVVKLMLRHLKALKFQTYGLVIFWAKGGSETEKNFYWPDTKVK